MSNVHTLKIAPFTIQHVTAESSIEQRDGGGTQPRLTLKMDIMPLRMPKTRQTEDRCVLDEVLAALERLRTRRAHEDASFKEENP